MERPPRWLKCPRKSEVIADQFLVFKTFLDERYDAVVPVTDRFQFEMLLSYLKNNEMEMGLIIDLTNTSRFYKSEITKKHGIRYCKLQCRGHGEAPSNEQVAMFIKICQSFYENNPGKLIGVHCTHGFNRSGFLVACYLVEQEDWSVDDAHAIFAKARPPGIYKQQYINDLWQRYEGSAEDSATAPALPDWCYEDENHLDDDGFDQSHNRQENNSLEPEKKRLKGDEALPKFVDGVKNVDALQSEDLIKELQNICSEMCEWQRKGFSGSQPVSMDRQNLNFLSEKPYRVSWKADGTRYLMLILGQDKTYLFDRDNSVFHAKHLVFPQRKKMNDFMYDTLVDGELVFDKEGETLHPRFLIYDIIKFQGQDVGKTDLDRRLHCIQKEIVDPRNAAVKEGRLDKRSEPFSIRKKDFFKIEKASWILQKFMPKITHETDGLIFQPAIEPYISGTCPTVLKWKPPELNSVDFQLRISLTEPQMGMVRRKAGHLLVMGFPHPFSEIELSQEVRKHDKRIIECTWHNNKWKFLRVREDKSFPNSFNTAKSVCESIKNPVTEAILLDVIEKSPYKQT